MGLVALVALEIRHWSVARDLMTSQAPVIGHCGYTLIPEGMALHTRKGLHPYSMDPLILMAVPAGVLIRLEEVKTHAMTDLAFDIQHKHMTCMAVRLRQGDRSLGNLAEMALPASSPGFFPSMGLGKRSRSFRYKSDQKLILFYETQVVTLLAYHIPVLALLPLVEGLLHHVA